MINCPHCGEPIFKEPYGFDKLSHQQAEIFRIFVDNPTKIYTYQAVARIIYANDPNGGPADVCSTIRTQIHRIRKRIGDVIETTYSGYRLRISNEHDNSDKSTTESETT